MIPDLKAIRARAMKAKERSEKPPTWGTIGGYHLMLRNSADDVLALLTEQERKEALILAWNDNCIRIKDEREQAMHERDRLAAELEVAREGLNMRVALLGDSEIERGRLAAENVKLRAVTWVCDNCGREL